MERAGRPTSVLQSSRISKYDTLKLLDKMLTVQPKLEMMAKLNYPAQGSGVEWSAFYIKLFLLPTLPPDILGQFLPDISTSSNGG